MNKIREETKDIYITFWNRYDSYISKLLCHTISDEYQNVFLEELNNTKTSTKTSTKIPNSIPTNTYCLANLFSLYFYIIDYVDIIYNNNCKSSDEVLSILSMYSLICKEFDYFFRLHLNLDDIFVMEINQEIINSMCIVNNLKDEEISKLLCDDVNETNDIDNKYIHYNHIINAKQRLFKLYLKLLSII
tara:strand:- start:790 stop:1356 length:567 start_codon:yes stop_codon:yes gene_type:complete